MSQKTIPFSIYLSWYAADKYLEVLVVPLGKRFFGPAVKTERRGNISVGVSRDGVPLYIRLKEAQTIDKALKSLATRMEHNKQPSGFQMTHLVKKASEVMKQVMGGRAITFNGIIKKLNYCYE